MVAMVCKTPDTGDPLPSRAATSRLQKYCLMISFTVLVNSHANAGKGSSRDEQCAQMRQRYAHAPPNAGVCTCSAHVCRGSPYTHIAYHSSRLRRCSTQTSRAPYSTTSRSPPLPFNLRRAPLVPAHPSISRGTQTDPINIRAEELVRPIFRGLVSLVAVQVLLTFNSIHFYVTRSPALRALCRTYIVYCLRPVLRGVHFLLIWIGVFIRILSAVIAIITPDPM